MRSGGTFLGRLGDNPYTHGRVQANSIVEAEWVKTVELFECLEGNETLQAGVEVPEAGMVQFPKVQQSPIRSH